MNPVPSFNLLCTLIVPWCASTIALAMASPILNRSRFDLADTVGRIVQNFENDCRDRGITVSYSGEPAVAIADQTGSAGLSAT